jgi:hypothetical protein
MRNLGESQVVAGALLRTADKTESHPPKQPQSPPHSVAAASLSNRSHRTPKRNPALQPPPKKRARGKPGGMIRRRETAQRSPEGEASGLRANRGHGWPRRASGGAPPGLPPSGPTEPAPTSKDLAAADASPHHQRSRPSWHVHRDRPQRLPPSCQPPGSPSARDRDAHAPRVAHPPA